MAETTRRVLALLSLLESKPVWSGPDIAERLGVTTRTVRRDVDRLRELGYPVEGTHGPDGGYRLGRGGRLPPLVLDDAEAVAVALCLRQVAGSGVTGIEEEALRALAKLDQVLPARLAAEVHAIDEATAGLPGAGGPRVDVARLTDLVRASREAMRVRFDYLARDGTASSRQVEPYRLVTTGRLWYLFCFDLDRDDWRTFRLDRMAAVHVTTFGFRPRAAPDPVDHISSTGARLTWRHNMTAIFDAPLEEVRARIPLRWAHSEAEGPHRTRVTAGDDELTRVVRHFARAALDLDVRLEVVEPPEAIEEMRRLGERIGSFAP